MPAAASEDAGLPFVIDAAEDRRHATERGDAPSIRERDEPARIPTAHETSLVTDVHMMTIMLSVHRA
jgi:hypothetical protein